MEKTEKMSRFEAETLPYLQPLWQTAIYLTLNEQDAENLVEDTYIEAFKAWDESILQTGSKIKVFKILIKILAKNIKMNFRTQIGLTNEQETFSSESISVLNVIPSNVIKEAIEKLPLEIRLVIILSNLERFSYSEIAEIIGIHRKIVRIKIYQGCRLIQQELIKYLAAGSLNQIAG
jgi:RNA polymerase sigma-70 factor, ECF subfamily